MDRIYQAIQTTHPAQRVLQLLLLPVALGVILPMQQAAATTLAGKDADRIASFRACAFQLTDLGVNLAPPLACDPNRGGLGWQCPDTKTNLPSC